MRPFNRKSRLQRLRKAGIPEVGSDKALKTGVIAAGGLAALTAASAGISSLRREGDG